MKAAIYARVSTANNGQDPTMQTRELREYCECRGWTVAGEYVDIGISGTKEKRPELDRLMGDAHRRRFDAVVVWKFDRFARSVSHLLRALEAFKAQGIDFVSYSEQMDTSTPAGKMVFTVLGAVAELERSLIVERVRAGLRNAKAKGKSLGRPRLAVDAARIAALRSQGLSWAKIGEQLGLGEGTVRRTEHPPKNPSKSPLQLPSNQQPAEANSHPPETTDSGGRASFDLVGLSQEKPHATR
jgi:DNA invertase Pin-like site-specific DNA recombinase